MSDHKADGHEVEEAARGRHEMAYGGGTGVWTTLTTQFQEVDWSLAETVGERTGYPRDVFRR